MAALLISKIRKDGFMNNWEELRESCLECRRCPLAQTRTNVVFGVGSKDAEVMFIGEGPGQQEDLKGEPFVGRSGQLLDKLMATVDLYRDRNIYIANIVKCRPPQNRDPLPEEQDACAGWLDAQIALMKPKIVVCVGRIAAQRYISKDFRVTKEHGVFYDIGGIQFMGTYHPASLLRNPRQKPEAFEDFLALRDKINEICERTY